jgi:short-subunit dehydrogenase
MKEVVMNIKSSIPSPANLRISIHKVDVGIPGEIASMFEEIQEYHQIQVDILVSNAGSVCAYQVPNLY